jgi:hypothetical protein
VLDRLNTASRAVLRAPVSKGAPTKRTNDALVKVTGEALAVVPKATTIDTIVMATAARRGGVVFTSDVGVLLRLQRVFPSVRVFAV